MVDKVGKKPKRHEKWVYFFLNGQLHKTLKTVRSEDIIVAWAYSENKRIAYSLSAVYIRRKRAYTVPQTAKILNRHVDSIKRHFRQGNIKKPRSKTHNHNIIITKLRIPKSAIWQTHGGC